MRLARARTGALLAPSAALVALATLVAPGRADACGGCFSPVPPSAPGLPPNPQAVLQDAERVIFLRDDTTKTSTVWVEVRYTGLASEFGWVLPLPKQPTVSVGTSAGLDRLDKATGIRFKVQPLPAENCRDPQDGCELELSGSLDAGTSADAFSSDGAMGGGDGGPKGIEILDQGQAGPYDYTVIQGKDGAQLQSWLDTRGYKTPSSAVPILQSHADKGDVFVAIKLSSGNGVNLIRPVVLTMQDAEPCVPLRLTSIAAADDVNVVVTIAGGARAIPKNMLHVEPNPARMNWLSLTTAVPNNYAQVLSAAIDEAAGRAFVTESALPGAEAGASLPSGAKLDTAWAKDAKNLHDLAVALYDADPLGSTTPWLHADAATVFETVGIVEPIFVTFDTKNPVAALGQLWVCGGIWSGKVFSPTGTETCVPAGESFNSPSVTYTATQAKAVAIDGTKLSDALQEQIAKPLATLHERVAAAPVVTRLVMRIGPKEMDRDPVFAFNPTLPMVPAQRLVERGFSCASGWLPATHIRVGVPGAGSYLISTKLSSSATDPRFADAPFAARIEAIDETGAPVLVGAKQIELVDTALLGAVVGKPSPVAGLALTPATPWQAPASDPPATKLVPWSMPPGCTPKAGWVDGKMPPGGPDEPDAGPTDVGTDTGSSDTVSADAGPSDGSTGPKDDDTVGVSDVSDAGQTLPPADTQPEGTTTRGSSSGCSAAAAPIGADRWGWLAAALGAALLVLARRRRSR